MRRVLSLIEGGRASTEPPAATRVAPLLPSGLRSPTDLGARIRAIAVDVDRMWRAALESGDFDLVTRSTEASHALHRAVLVLENDPTLG